MINFSCKLHTFNNPTRILAAATNLFFRALIRDPPFFGSFMFQHHFRLMTLKNPAIQLFYSLPLPF